jgi:hypothetical protein
MKFSKMIMNNTIKLYNKYTFFARYIPALLSVLPITLVYFFLTKRFSSYDLKEYLQSMAFFLGVGLTFLLSYFLSMIVRELGSFLEKKYFKNRMEFPTNTMMLYEDDRLPKATKDAYGKKIIADFKINRLSETKEKNDRFEALKTLHQASRFVCAKYQQHSQVKDANIAYGFVRNLSGGLFISLPASVAGIVTGIILNDRSLLLWSCVSIMIFGLLLLFHRKLIKENAEKFAYKILTVYLSDFAVA